MNGKSHAMHKSNCACCGLISNSAKDGLCTACHELLLRPTVTMVDAANQTDLITSDTLENLENIKHELKSQSDKEKIETTVIKTITKSVTNSPSIELKTKNDSTKLNQHSNNKSGKVIKQKLKNRCLICKKKFGVINVQCRCGGTFCAFHRYSDRHDCKFDYRAWGAAEILRNNPRVVAAKIDKI